MTISELIAHLEALKEQHGDVGVQLVSEDLGYGDNLEARQVVFSSREQAVLVNACVTSGYFDRAVG